MKTIEEKAKAYDEALERAKDYHKQLLDEDNPEWAGEIENIFPELVELEGERIRKWIIDDIRYNMNNEPLNNSEYKKQAQKALAWLEKQAPKLKWTNEDESKVKEIVYFLETAKVHYASTTALDDCIEWLNTLK